MLKWLFYLPFSLLFTVLCYVTNPIVVLFANKDGELPSFLHLWQTWDDSIFNEFAVSCAPKFLQYDWKAHYREYKGTTAYLESVNRERWFTVCINDDFSLWELIQRYVCAVLWLTRNSAYGFCFYWLGADVSPYLKVSQSEHVTKAKEIWGGNLFGAWCYCNSAPFLTIFGRKFTWNTYLGWKIDLTARVVTRAMIANRISFKVRKEGEQ